MAAGRGVRLAAVLLGAMAAPSRGSSALEEAISTNSTGAAPELLACGPEEHARYACLRLRGVDGLVRCAAVQGRVGYAPAFPDDFAGQPVQVCPGECTVFVHGLVPDRAYRAFCAQVDSATADRASAIVPPCSGDDGLPHCGAPVSTAGSRESKGHEHFGHASLFVSLLLIVYMVWSFRFEHVHGVHETAVTVVVGLALGFVTYYIDGETPVFSYDVFSYFVLPMVIFDAGFNLEKSRFFWYVTPIVALGIIGTVTIFMLIYVCSGLNEIFPDIFKTLHGSDIELSVQERLVMASVLASTDSVAPIAFLPKDMYPRLFAIVFGEGVLNDVVAILLSTSVTNSDALPSILEISTKIGYYLVTSSFMGVSFGFSVSKLFKHSQWLHEEVVHPCALMLLLNYICYVLTEMCDFSSIFALFVCSLLCGHYAQESLSEDAKTFADQISEFLAYCAEAFVFGYFGMTAVGYLMEPDQFSPTLIIFYSVLIVLSRALAVMLLSILMRVTGLYHLSIKWNHIVVIMMAGCMRGAIAYALILKAVPPHGQQSPEEVVMVSTVLGIVLLNCLVFGGMFPAVMRCLGIEAAQPSVNRGISFSCLESAEASHHYRRRTQMLEAWSHFDHSRLKPLLQRSRDWSHPEPQSGVLETRARTLSI